MTGKNRIALLGFIVAALVGFVAVGSWWSGAVLGPEASSKATATRVEDSLAALEKKARNEPAKAVNFTRLGEAYKAAGRLTEAVSAYVSAAELAPGDTEVQRALISLKAMAEAKGRH